MTEAPVDTGTAPGGGSAPTTNTPWLGDTIDQETRGYFQNRGWDKLTPAEAALNAAKAHREAEKHIGAPANEILRLPKQGDEAGWKAVYQRLGAPSSPDGYDFSPVKFKDGTTPDEGFTNWLRETAAVMNLPKEAATRLASEMVKRLESADEAEAAENAAKLNDAKRNLERNWGANANANMFIAQQGAKALGVDAEVIDSLQTLLGYDKVMGNVSQGWCARQGRSVCCFDRGWRRGDDPRSSSCHQGRAHA